MISFVQWAQKKYPGLSLVGTYSGFAEFALLFLTEAKDSHLERLLGEFYSFTNEGTALPVSTELQEIIYGNALMNNLSPQLVTAVIQVESSFRPNARSPKGACGLMQITPLVWRFYNPHSQCNGKHLPGRVDHGKDCIYDIELNIATGARYLKDLITYYNGEVGRALEAYNAGLTNVDLEKLKPKYRRPESTFNGSVACGVGSSGTVLA